MPSPHLTLVGSRVAQWSKALHLSARGNTTDPGLIPGCTTTGRDWVVHIWPSVVRVVNKNLLLTDLPS